MADLPKRITAVAFCASNGELAWFRTDIEEAIVAIGNTHLAIIRGEVWHVVPPNDWIGFITLRNGETAIWHWEAEPRHATEEWAAYCQRCSTASIDIVRNMIPDLDREAAPETIEHLYFNLMYVEEREM